MTIKNNHSPENWSEKYSYTPTIDDYMQVYRKYTRKSAQIIREKIRLCLTWELIAFFAGAVIFSYTKNPSTIDLLTNVWLTTSIAILLVIPASHGFVYRCQLHTTIRMNPFLLERRYISFDGYHFISESDHLIQMFPVREHVQTDIDKTGIYLICCDAVRYYPLRIFGSATKMHEFYARLQWNDAYEDKYVKK